MADHVYSFANVTCTLVGPGGFISLANGSAKEGITFSSAEATNTMTVGADGSGMHSLRMDRSGTVTVRLLKTSATNKLLAAMYGVQRSSAKLHGQNTIALVDTARGDTITCQQCAFSKLPDLNYGTDAGLVEWQFQTIRIDIGL